MRALRVVLSTSSLRSPEASVSLILCRVARLLYAMGKYSEAREFVKNARVKVAKAIRDKIEKAPEKDAITVIPEMKPDEIEENSEPVAKAVFERKGFQFQSEKVLEDELTMRMEAGRGGCFGLPLKIYKRRGEYGRQFVFPNRGPLVLLPEDAEKNLYIIELKKDSGYDDVYKQTIREAFRTIKYHTVCGDSCENAGWMIDLRTVSFEYKEEVTELEHLRCVVERITYQNAENGYSVIKCRAKGYQDLVTVVGSMPDVHVGSVLYLGGSWKIDGKYGRQFAMETFEETLPATVYGIEKYLGSGLIKGVGPKFARRIVQQFGKDTLDVIEEDPDRLLEVPGIGKMRVERIKKSWQEQKEIKNIMLFLQSHDVSTSHATKIFKTYGNESVQVVQENPYRLADDIWGIGFRTADTIAEKMGFDHEKYVRLRSGLLYTLNQLSETGHCYATRDMLMKTGAQLLAVEDNLLSITLDEMIRTEDVVTDSIPAGGCAALLSLRRPFICRPFIFRSGDGQEAYSGLSQ